MAYRKTERNPLFAGRWFEDDIILLCLRWYFRFKLSYRDLVVILGERGLSISHTTILRWVVRYAETCEKRWSRFERPVGGSWRVDETFIKVRGQWMYLYRAVDGQGNTVEFYLSRTRGIAAAKAFFRKALTHHREPHSITLDGHQPSHSALRRMGMNGEFNGCVATFKTRQESDGLDRPSSVSCGYLEQLVDQLNLLPNIRTAHPPSLPLPDHVHGLISLDRSPRCVEFTKALLRLYASFDRPMILLQDVVQVLDRSVAATAAQDSFLLHS